MATSLPFGFDGFDPKGLTTVCKARRPGFLLRPNPYCPNHRLLCCLVVSSLLFLLLAAAGYLLFPSDPDLTLARIRLNHIQVQYTSPKPSFNLSLFISLRVFNRDFFSLNYSSLDVSVGYQGQKLGLVTSIGGHVRARGTSYVNATLDLDGLQVIQDVFYLLEDLARGSIPFDTDSVVNGTIRLFFLNLPIKEGPLSATSTIQLGQQIIVSVDLSLPVVCKQMSNSHSVHS